MSQTNSKLKLPSQREKYSFWLKAFREKFPEQGDNLLSFFSACTNHVDYGVLTLSNGGLIPKHCNYKQSFNKHGYYRSRTKSDIMCHLLDLEDTDLFYFTSEPTRFTTYGDSFVYVVLDFDNKDKVETYEAFLSRIKQSLNSIGLQSLYYCPSKSKFGVHAHILFRTHREHKDDICSLLSILTGTLRERFIDLNFDRICGTPAVFSSEEYETSGVLGMLPRIANDIEAADFLAKMQQTVYLEGLLQQLQERASRSTVTDCWKPTPVSPKAQTLTQENIHSNTPNERMNFAARDFVQKNRRIPSIIELVFHYEALELHTGQDKNNRRVDRAVSTIEFLQKTFDPAKLKIPFSQKDAEELFTKLAIHPDCLVWKTGKRLSMELVCKFPVYFTQLMTIKHNDRPHLDGTVSSVQVMKHFGINGKQYSRLKHIMNDYDVIKQVSDSYYTGVSKKYCFGKNHPLYKE